MPYIPLFQILPDVAENETRVITLLNENNDFGLPKGEYAFIELYCNECDCRRVFLNVIFNGKSEATIAYGWESISFYKKLFKGFNAADYIELIGPTLDSFQYQSKHAAGILLMFNKILLQDKNYLDRLKRHYSDFKLNLKKSNK